MVNANFNQFANMTQAEILKQVSQANNLSNVALANNSIRNNQNNSSFIIELTKDFRERTEKQQDSSLKRVVGEASVTDVVMASVQTKTIVKIATEFRNKMQDFIDKTMNINI